MRPTTRRTKAKAEAAEAEARDDAKKAPGPEAEPSASAVGQGRPADETPASESEAAAVPSPVEADVPSPPEATSQSPAETEAAVQSPPRKKQKVILLKPKDEVVEFEEEEFEEAEAMTSPPAKPAAETPNLPAGVTTANVLKVAGARPHSALATKDVLAVAGRRPPSTMVDELDGMEFALEEQELEDDDEDDEGEDEEDDDDEGAEPAPVEAASEAEVDEGEQPSLTPLSSSPSKKVAAPQTTPKVKRKVGGFLLCELCHSFKTKRKAMLRRHSMTCAPRLGAGVVPSRVARKRGQNAAKMAQQQQQQKCAQCDFTARKESQLLEHVETVHERRVRRKCPRCPLTFPYQQDLHLHIKRTHLKIKDHKCEWCKYDSATFLGLSKHMKRKHQIDDFNFLLCEFCPTYKASKQTELNAHVRKEHKRELREIKKRPKIRCSLCRIELTTLDNLADHYRDDHKPRLPETFPVGRIQVHAATHLPDYVIQKLLRDNAALTAASATAADGGQDAASSMVGTNTVTIAEDAELAKLSDVVVQDLLNRAAVAASASASENAASSAAAAAAQAQGGRIEPLIVLQEEAGVEDEDLGDEEEEGGGGGPGRQAMRVAEE